MENDKNASLETTRNDAFWKRRIESYEEYARLPLIVTLSMFQYEYWQFLSQ